MRRPLRLLCSVAVCVLACKDEPRGSWELVAAAQPVDPASSIAIDGLAAGSGPVRMLWTSRDAAGSRTVHLEREDAGAWVVETESAGCEGKVLHGDRALAACGSTSIWNGTEWIAQPGPAGAALWDGDFDQDGAPLAFVVEQYVAERPDYTRNVAYRFDGSWRTLGIVGGGSMGAGSAYILARGGSALGVVVVVWNPGAGEPNPAKGVILGAADVFRETIPVSTDVSEARLSFDEAGRPIVALLGWDALRRVWTVWVGRWDGAEWVRAGEALGACSTYPHLPPLPVCPPPAGVACDPQGRIVVAWLESAGAEATSPQVLHVSRLEGGTWNEVGRSPVATVKPHVPDSRWPSQRGQHVRTAQLTLAADGEPIVAFTTPGGLLEVRRFRP